MPNTQNQNSLITIPFLKVIKNEWQILLPYAIITFILASILTSGWPKGLIPEIRTPLNYEGDGLSYYWHIKRVFEGLWTFNDPHSGFPFVASSLDFPHSDTGSYVILWLISRFFTSPVAAINIYYFLGYSAIAIAAHAVMRAVGVSRLLAITGSFLYAFLTFHFVRLGHLFFTWYFVVPLYFYFGFLLFSEKTIFFNKFKNFKDNFLTILSLIFLSSFGIYYSFFGCIVLCVCGILAAILTQNWRPFITGLLATSFIALGVVLNVLPSLFNILINGSNREGVNRGAGESELYSLKLVQMLIPRADHRFKPFAKFASEYNLGFPYITENASASLGMVGSIGLILLLISVFTFSLAPPLRENVVKNQNSVHNFTINSKLLILSLIIVLLFFITTVGGFSSLFAMLVSTSIRGWNRISIYIAFLSIIAFMLVLDFGIAKYVKTTLQTRVKIFLTLGILFLGLYDQTVKPCLTCIEGNRIQYENDRNFILEIEKILPKNAAVFQLPYVAFPENEKVNNIGSYDQLRANIHSFNLNWNFGNMRGREGDWFYRKLSLMPINQQLTIARAIGFSGIFINKNGYVSSESDIQRCSVFQKSKLEKIKNNCLTLEEVEKDISDALGSAVVETKMESKDRELLFYRLADQRKEAISDAENLVLAKDYLKTIGFDFNNGKPVLIGNFEGLIDLREETLHRDVAGTTGMSGISVENGARVGRWSDAYLGPKVVFWLAKPLAKRITVVLRARAAGPNFQKPLEIKIGKQVQKIVLTNTFEDHMVSFDLAKHESKIEFTPFEPFVPAKKWGGNDYRLVAVEFESLNIKAD